MSTLARDVSEEARHLITALPQIHVDDLVAGAYLVPNSAFRIDLSDVGRSVQFSATSRGTHLNAQLRFATKDGAWKTKDFTIVLDSTACAIRGMRRWFKCPTRGCERRVAALFLDGQVLACRNCHQLVYESQRRGPRDRAIAKAISIRRTLGGAPQLFAAHPARPSRMRVVTYERLINTLDELELLLDDWR
jgi:hypothetical protein